MRTTGNWPAGAWAALSPPATQAVARSFAKRASAPGRSRIAAPPSTRLGISCCRLFRIAVRPGSGCRFELRLMIEVEWQRLLVEDFELCTRSERSAELRLAGGPAGLSCLPRCSAARASVCFQRCDGPGQVLYLHGSRAAAGGGGRRLLAAQQVVGDRLASSNNRPTVRAFGRCSRGLDRSRPGASPARVPAPPRSCADMGGMGGLRGRPRLVRWGYEPVSILSGHRCRGSSVHRRGCSS